MTLATLIGNKIIRAINSFNVAITYKRYLYNEKRWYIAIVITLKALVMILRRFNGGISANGDDVDAVCRYNTATYILNSANATSNTVQLILEVALIGAGLVWTSEISDDNDSSRLPRSIYILSRYATWSHTYPRTPVSLSP